MNLKKKDIEEFCEDFLYPFVILYGLENAFLGVAEFYNGHKILIYDKEMIYSCFSEQGYPPDIIEEKFLKFFEFWKELQKTPEGVFSGQKEDVIKKHLPALVTRFKNGVNPILETISYKESPESEKKELKLKEQIIEDERRTNNVLSETRDLLQSL
tara:strand:+ start:20 stop:487 length:468 start_codon:yes stop_codon:yes gene_type:complete